MIRLDTVDRLNDRRYSIGPSELRQYDTSSTLMQGLLLQRSAQPSFFIQQRHRKV